MAKLVNNTPSQQNSRQEQQNNRGSSGAEELVDQSFANQTLFRQSATTEPAAKSKVATAPVGSGLEEKEEGATAKAKAKVSGDAPVIEKFVPGAVTFNVGQVPGLQTADKGAAQSGNTADQGDLLSRQSLSLATETKVEVGMNLLKLLKAQAMERGANMAAIPGTGADGAETSISQEVRNFTLQVRVPGQIRSAERRLQASGVLVMAGE